MAKETQMMDVHRKKCSISQEGRKCQSKPIGKLFYTHQIGKELGSLTASGADADADGGIAYTPWRVCTLVPQHWEMTWLY